MAGATEQGGGQGGQQMPAQPEREVLKRLKANTREEHELIEETRIMRALFADGFAREHYRMVLTALYGFYAPLEAALKRMPPAGLALAPRLKCDKLAGDLGDLGCRTRQLGKLPSCARLPELPDAVGALGALYVLDGASMGGAVILKHLSGRLDPKTLRATRFYQGYGKQTGARWRSLQDAIVEAVRREPAAEERLTATAIGTFRSMRLWLEAHPVAEAVLPVTEEDSSLADETSAFSSYLSEDLTSQIGRRRSTN